MGNEWETLMQSANDAYRQRHPLALLQYKKCLLFLNQQMMRKDLGEKSQMALRRAFSILRHEWFKISQDIASDPYMQASIMAVEARLTRETYHH